MSREIKFKVLVVKDIWLDTSTFIAAGEWLTYFPETFPIMFKDSLDLATRRQYTGLKDKNGVEIYEGDIVDCVEFYNAGGLAGYSEGEKPRKGVVVWHEGEFQLWPNPDTEYWGSDGSPNIWWLRQQDDELEVIGNIYENPELLK